MEAAQTKQYQVALDKVLKLFETSQEWPDLIANLGKVQKVILQHKQIPNIPNKYLLCNKLAQCLNPSLPSGVHLKSLQIYKIIFSIIGPEILFKDLSIYTPAILSLFPKSSLSVKPLILEIYEEYFLLPVINENVKHLVIEPGLTGFFISSFSGIEIGSEFTNRFYGIVNNIYQKLVDQYKISLNPDNDFIFKSNITNFYLSLWQAFITNSYVRLPMLNYLLENKTRLIYDFTLLLSFGMSNDLFFMEPNMLYTNRAIIIKGLLVGLNDSNVLVKRSALDVMLNGTPLKCLAALENIEDTKMRNALDEMNRELVKTLILLIAERNMTLQKRILAWLFPPTTCQSSSTSSSPYFPTPSVDHSPVPTTPADNLIESLSPVYGEEEEAADADARVLKNDVENGGYAAAPSEGRETGPMKISFTKRHKRTGSKDDTYYCMLRRPLGTTKGSSTVKLASMILGGGNNNSNNTTTTKHSSTTNPSRKVYGDESSRHHRCSESVINTLGHFDNHLFNSDTKLNIFLDHLESQIPPLMSSERGGVVGDNRFEGAKDAFFNPSTPEFSYFQEYLAKFSADPPPNLSSFDSSNLVFDRNSNLSLQHDLLQLPPRHDTQTVYPILLRCFILAFTTESSSNSKSQQALAVLRKTKFFTSINSSAATVFESPSATSSILSSPFSSHHYNIEDPLQTFYHLCHCSASIEARSNVVGPAAATNRKAVVMTKLDKMGSLSSGSTSSQQKLPSHQFNELMKRLLYDLSPYIVCYVANSVDCDSNVASNGRDSTNSIKNDKEFDYLKRLLASKYYNIPFIESNLVSLTRAVCIINKGINKTQVTTLPEDLLDHWLKFLVHFNPTRYFSLDVTTGTFTGFSARDNNKYIYYGTLWLQMMNTSILILMYNAYDLVDFWKISLSADTFTFTDSLSFLSTLDNLVDALTKLVKLKFNFILTLDDIVNNNASGIKERRRFNNYGDRGGRFWNFFLDDPASLSPSYKNFFFLRDKRSFHDIARNLDRVTCQLNKMGGASYALPVDGAGSELHKIVDTFFTTPPITTAPAENTNGELQQQLERETKSYEYLCQILGLVTRTNRNVYKCESKILLPLVYGEYGNYSRQLTSYIFPHFFKHVFTAIFLDEGGMGCSFFTFLFKQQEDQREQQQHCVDVLSPSIDSTTKLNNILHNLSTLHLSFFLYNGIGYYYPHHQSSNNQYKLSINETATIGDTTIITVTHEDTLYTLREYILSLENEIFHTNARAVLAPLFTFFLEYDLYLTHHLPTTDFSKTLGNTNTNNDHHLKTTLSILLCAEEFEECLAHVFKLSWNNLPPSMAPYETSPELYLSTSDNTCVGAELLFDLLFHTLPESRVAEHVDAFINHEILETATDNFAKLNTAIFKFIYLWKHFFFNHNNLCTVDFKSDQDTNLLALYNRKVTCLSLFSLFSTLIYGRNKNLPPAVHDCCGRDPSSSALQLVDNDVYLSSLVLGLFETIFKSHRDQGPPYCNKYYEDVLRYHFIRPLLHPLVTVLHRSLTPGLVIYNTNGTPTDSKINVSSESTVAEDTLNYDFHDALQELDDENQEHFNDFTFINEPYNFTNINTILKILKSIFSHFTKLPSAFWIPLLSIENFNHMFNNEGRLFFTLMKFCLKMFPSVLNTTQISELNAASYKIHQENTLLAILIITDLVGFAIKAQYDENNFFQKELNHFKIETHLLNYLHSIISIISSNEVDHSSTKFQVLINQDPSFQYCSLKICEIHKIMLQLIPIVNYLPAGNDDDKSPKPQQQQRNLFYIYEMLVLDGKMRRKILETIRKLFQTDRYHRGLVVRTELKFWIEWFTQACQFTLNLLCTGLNKTPYKNNNNTSWITYDLNQCTESLLTTIVSVLNSFVHVIYYQSDFSTLNHIDLTCFNAFLNLFTCLLSRASSPSFYKTCPYNITPASSHLLLFAFTGITKKKLANDSRKSKANFMVAQNRNSLDVFDLAKVLWAYFVPVYLEFLRNIRSSSNIDDDDNDKILNTKILKHFFRFPDDNHHLSSVMANTDSTAENAYSLNDPSSRLLNGLSVTFLDNLMSGDNNSVNNNNNNPPFSGEYYELDVTLNTLITSSLYHSLKLSNYSNLSISPPPLYDEQDRDDVSSSLFDATKGPEESADIPKFLRKLFTILYRSNVLSNYYLTTHSQLPHQEYSYLSSSSSMHNHKGVGFGHKLHQQHSNDVTTVLETTLSSKKQALEQAVAFLEYQFNTIKHISLSDDNNHSRQNLIKPYLIGLYLEREFKSGNLTIQQRGFDATTTPTTTGTLLKILPILQSLRNYYYSLMVNSSSSYVKILMECHESAPDAVKLYYELISNVIYLGLSSGSTSSWLLLGRKSVAVLEPPIPIPRAIIKPLAELEERDGAVDGHVEEPGKNSTPATPLQSPVVVVKHHYHSMERPKLKLGFNTTTLGTHFKSNPPSPTADGISEHSGSNKSSKFPFTQLTSSLSPKKRRYNLLLRGAMSSTATKKGGAGGEDSKSSNTNLTAANYHVSTTENDNDTTVKTTGVDTEDSSSPESTLLRGTVITSSGETNLPLSDESPDTLRRNTSPKNRGDYSSRATTAVAKSSGVWGSEKKSKTHYDEISAATFYDNRGVTSKLQFSNYFLLVNSSNSHPQTTTTNQRGRRVNFIDVDYVPLYHEFCSFLPPEPPSLSSMSNTASRTKQLSNYKASVQIGAEEPIIENGKGRLTTTARTCNPILGTVIAKIVCANYRDCMSSSSAIFSNTANSGDSTYPDKIMKDSTTEEDAAAASLLSNHICNIVIPNLFFIGNSFEKCHRTYQNPQPHVLGLLALDEYLFDLIQTVFNEETIVTSKSENGLYFAQGIPLILFPFLKERRSFNSQSFEICCRLMEKIFTAGPPRSSSLTITPTDNNNCLFTDGGGGTVVWKSYRVKLLSKYKKDIWELFVSEQPGFFQTSSPAALVQLGRVINELFLADHNDISDILAHVTNVSYAYTSPIIQMFSRNNTEYDNSSKLDWLKRFAFVVLNGKIGQYDSLMPIIQEKLVEMIETAIPYNSDSLMGGGNNGKSSTVSSLFLPFAAATPNGLTTANKTTTGNLSWKQKQITLKHNVLSLVYLCLPCLIFKMSPARFYGLWPTVMSLTLLIVNDFRASLSKYYTINRRHDNHLPILKNNINNSQPADMQLAGTELKSENFYDQQPPSSTSLDTCTLTGSVPPSPVTPKVTLRHTPLLNNVLQKCAARPQSLPLQYLAHGEFSKLISYTGTQDSLTKSNSLSIISNSSPAHNVEDHDGSESLPGGLMPSPRNDTEEDNISSRIPLYAYDTSPPIYSESTLDLILNLCRFIDAILSLPSEYTNYVQINSWCFSNPKLRCCKLNLSPLNKQPPEDQTEGNFDILTDLEHIATSILQHYNFLANNTKSSADHPVAVNSNNDFSAQKSSLFCLSGITRIENLIDLAPFWLKILQRPFEIVESAVNLPTDAIHRYLTEIFCQGYDDTSTT